MQELLSFSYFLYLLELLSCKYCRGIRWCVVSVHNRQDNRVGKVSVQAKE